MPPSPLTLVRPSAPVSADREQQIAKLTKALYQADQQQKFLDLQAEVDTLLCKLQSCQRVHS
jgi:hypothetical protein